MESTDSGDRFRWLSDLRGWHAEIQIFRYRFRKGLSALARKFGDVFGRRTRSLLAASRCPFGAETERCSSSNAGVALATRGAPAFRARESRTEATRTRLLSMDSGHPWVARCT